MAVIFTPRDGGGYNFTLDGGSTGTIIEFTKQYFFEATPTTLWAIKLDDNNVARHVATSSEDAQSWVETNLN